MAGASHDEGFEPFRPADADRDAVVASLRRAVEADRLTLVGFEQRVQAVYRAQTLAELQRLAEELPAPAVSGPRAATPRPLWKRPAVVGTVAGLLGLAAGAALGAGPDEAPPRGPVTVDAATTPLEYQSARAAAEGWFERCDASQAAVDGARAGAGELDRVADVVPHELVADAPPYSHGGPLGPSGPSNQHWLLAAIGTEGFVRGYSAVFQSQNNPTTSWVIQLYEFPDPERAVSVARDGLNALVCQFGAETFDAGIAGSGSAALGNANEAHTYVVVGPNLVISS